MRVDDVFLAICFYMLKNHIVEKKIRNETFSEFSDHARATGSIIRWNLLGVLKGHEAPSFVLQSQALKHFTCLTLRLRHGSHSEAVC